MTLLVGKARSLAARRRAKRDEPSAAPRIEGVPADDGVAEAAAAVPANEGGGPADEGAGSAEEGAGPARRVGFQAPTAGLPARLYGRDGLLRRLAALVWAPDGRAHVLAGADGTGKTAIALWVAREVASRGVPVWWVPAADARTLTVSLLDLAADLGAQPAEVAQAGAGERDAADLLWRYLEQRAPWLLVFDGADDPAALAEPGWLRRTQGGLIVVTSRSAGERTWGPHAELHPAGPLDPAAGGNVLADLAPHGGSALQAAALAERLGGLPLALRHAGSLLTASGQAFSDYGPVDSRDVVAGTRELALEALAAGGRPQARALLRVLCCLAPSAVIPAGMLDMDVLGRVCDGDAGLAKKGLRALARVGLIAGQDAGVTVHPLVCETSRVYTGDAARAAGGVAVAMLAAAAARLDATADWPAWVVLQPHVSAVYDYLGGVLGDADLAALTAVASATAQAFLHAGRTAAAAELATDALRHARRLRARHNDKHSGEHTAVLALCDAVALGTGYQLARLLARQGQYEGAQQCLRELLDAQARTLGPDHLSTLTARHEFGLVLAQRGQYAQAAREFGDLLAARVRVLGPEHRDTRVTRRWLAHLTAADATLRSG
jgi:hypothetical protein